MTKGFFIIFVSIVASQIALGATFDPQKGKTEFFAVVRPSGIRIIGTGAAPSGNFEIKKSGTSQFVTGQVEVDLNSFDTGMSMRNSHMKEKYLQTDKFPKALLTIDKWPVTAEILEKGGEVAGEGELNLHGNSRKIPIKIQIDNKAGELTITSHFKVQLSQFEIEQPKFAKLVVSDDVEISTQSALPKASLGIEN